MNEADNAFLRQFGVVLILIVVFGFSMYFIANAIGADAHAKMLERSGVVAQRIAPFGQSRIGDPAQQTQPSGQVASSAPDAGTGVIPTQSRTGSEVYQTACMVCHATGVAEAPLFGNVEAWTPRVAQGFDVLVGSVVNGKGAMPPKAGYPALSEDEIRSAIAHILEGAGFKATDG